MIAIAAGVQDLQADFSVVLMDGVGNNFVVCDLFARGECTAQWLEPACNVRGESTGYNHSNATFGTLFVVCGKLWKSIGKLLKICVHGAHDDTVFEGGVSDF